MKKLVNYDIIIGSEKNYTKKHLFRKIEVFSKVEKKTKIFTKMTMDPVSNVL